MEGDSLVGLEASTVPSPPLPALPLHVWARPDGSKFEAYLALKTSGYLLQVVGYGLAVLGLGCPSPPHRRLRVELRCWMGC
jgi:hypothetical protein